MNPKKQLMDGLFFQNPVTVQLLGMCSTMAITTTLFNGLGMGVSVLIILTLSNILIAALRKIMGLFIPLIVVNCIILGRAEAFSYKNTIAASTLDGIFQGLGYTIILVIMCVIREFLGAGTIMGGLLEIGENGQLVFGLGTAAGIRILPEAFPALGMILPVGGFLTLACLIAAMQYILNKPKKDKKTEEVAK